MPSQSSCRVATLALALFVAPLAGDVARAQSPAPTASRPQSPPRQPARDPSERRDSATASTAADDQADGDLVDDAERAVAAFTGALRDLGSPDTWTGARSPRTSSLRLLSTPLGRLGAVLVFFGVAVWSLFNPGRALIAAAWVSGFALVLVGERTGKMWLGVGLTLLYWVLLQWFLQRAASRRARTRTAWGDG